MIRLSEERRKELEKKLDEFIAKSTGMSEKKGQFLEEMALIENSDTSNTKKIKVAGMEIEIYKRVGLKNDKKIYTVLSHIQKLTNPDKLFGEDMDKLFDDIVDCCEKIIVNPLIDAKTLAESKRLSLMDLVEILVAYVQADVTEEEVEKIKSFREQS